MSDLPTSPIAFKAASEWLSGTPAAAALPNDTKLELYGVYKFLTTGTPSGSRPSIFYPTARAKYDAWTATHAKYSREERGEQSARERYIAIAAQVGWKGEGMDADEEEIDFDKDEEVGMEKEGGGMGPRVSALEEEGTVAQDGTNPLHDAVVDNNLDETRRLLQTDPRAVNAKDEFGNTPLHLAVDRGHEEIAEALLSSGADRTALDEDGQTPIQVAEMLSRTDIIALLR